MKNHVRAFAGGVVLSLAFAPAAYAVGTSAGASITNTASASFTDTGGNPKTITSNSATMHVDEVLNVTAVNNNAGNVDVSSPQTGVALSFKITNTGNGSEAFALTFKDNLTGDQFDPTNTRIYIDSNHDGIFDSAVDTLYVPGSNEPVLAADASQVIFVVADIPAGRAGSDVGQVSLKAEAVTAQATAGTDPAGFTFVGKGDNGTDAVVGSSQAEATITGGFVVSQALASLTKTQVVADPFGGTTPVPGATITYSLVFAATGSGSLTSAKVVDTIPANTTYVPGSITLDGAALTDIADADTGRFTSTQIEVLLNTVVAPASHTVTFKVKIN
jgi:uncharacterized repeat protein (TIGR01451 family)